MKEKEKDKKSSSIVVKLIAFINEIEKEKASKDAPKNNVYNAIN